MIIIYNFVLKATPDKLRYNVYTLVRLQKFYDNRSMSLVLTCWGTVLLGCLVESMLEYQRCKPFKHRALAREARSTEEPRQVRCNMK